MYVTRWRSIAESPAPGSQRSMSTALVPSSAGPRMPWTIPETWVSGDGISTRSMVPSPCATTRLASSATSVSCRWSAPLGAAVDPAV